MARAICLYTIIHTVWKLAQYCLFLITCFIRPTYLNNAYHERLYIEFTDDYISDLIDIQGFEQFKDTFYMHFFSIPDNHRHEFLSIFSVLINERQNSNALSPCVYKNYLQNLLILLCRYCDNKPASPASLVDTVSIADVSVQKGYELYYA